MSCTHKRGVMDLADGVEGVGGDEGLQVARGRKLPFDHGFRGQ